MTGTAIGTIAKSAFAAIAVAISLGACTSNDDWSQAQARHVTKVTLTRELHTVNYAPGSVQPSNQEIDRVAALARASNDGQAPQIMYVPAPGQPLVARRAVELQRVLAVRGVTVAAPTVLDAGMAAPGSVLVAARRYVATPPNCPDWSKRSETNYDNLPPSNFGCATERNLGVMVADPADLVRGREYGGQDGTASTLAVQRYRTGKIPPLPTNDTTTAPGSAK